MTPAEQELPFAAVNRLLPVLVLLVFAVAMGRRIDARRELLRQYSRTKRLLDERNKALETFMALLAKPPISTGAQCAGQAETKARRPRHR